MHKADWWGLPHFCLFCWTCGSSCLVHLLWITLCRHLWAHALILARFPAVWLVLHTHVSPVVACLQEEQEELLCCCTTFSFFLWTLAYTPLVASRCLWKVEQERRLLFFRPAALMQDRPVVSQAPATIQEGKAAMAGLFWWMLSQTRFPQVSGLQQCVKTKSPSGIVYAQCRPGIYHANAKLKHDIL